MYEPLFIFFSIKENLFPFINTFPDGGEVEAKKILTPSQFFRSRSVGWERSVSGIEQKPHVRGWKIFRFCFIQLQFIDWRHFSVVSLISNVLFSFDKVWNGNWWNIFYLTASQGRKTFTILTRTGRNKYYLAHECVCSEAQVHISCHSQYWIIKTFSSGWILLQPDDVHCR